MSGRRTPRGASTSPAASYGTQYRPHDLPPLPHGSILNFSFNRFDAPQACRDVGLVLLGALTSGSLIAACAIVLFVRF